MENVYHWNHIILWIKIFDDIVDSTGIPTCSEKLNLDSSEAFDV